MIRLLQQNFRFRLLYGSATELQATLDYDFSEEKKFSYRNLSMDEIIHHLALFVSRLWQIHVFGEGNTRTTAVFFIKYLELFLRNLLLNENHPLHNRTLHIRGTFKKIAKPDIRTEKPDIDSAKADIEKMFQSKTTNHILRLRETFPGQTIFGRSDVMETIDIKPSRASELLREMAEHGVIEPVSGHGKGKYRFRKG